MHSLRRKRGLFVYQTMLVVFILEVSDVSVSEPGQFEVSRESLGTSIRSYITPVTILK